MPELQHDLAISGHVQSVGRHRRPQGVPAHPLEPFPLTDGHHHTRMEIKAVRLGVTTAERRRLSLFERTPARVPATPMDGERPARASPAR